MVTSAVDALQFDISGMFLGWIALSVIWFVLGRLLRGRH